MRSYRTEFEVGGDVGYKTLEIWQLAREVAIDIHRMTIEKLPKFEMFEEGSQIRRSSKSVKSAIVEGYGRREYKQEFIRFLIYAIASNDETRDHLENLMDTGSLADREVFDSIHKRVETLGRKLHLFLQAVESSHLSKK
jgi:four helix bundle protein